MNVVDNKQKEWKGTSFSNSYLEAKQKSAEFTTYKNTDKRTWVAEKQDVDTLLGNIQTKLKTYNLAPYVPPSGLSLAVSSPPVYLCITKFSVLMAKTPLFFIQDLDKKWQGLLDSEANYHRSINGKIRE